MSQIKLSDHFDYRRLALFILPSIASTVGASLYGLVDGLFVSNFVGAIGLAAVNIIWPFFMLLNAVSSMLGTGGTALVAKLLGEGEKERALGIFSLVAAVAVIAGIILCIFGEFFIPTYLRIMNTDPSLEAECYRYGNLVFIALPFVVVQTLFSTFFVAAEKPKVGLYVSLMTGTLNVLFDWIFMVPFQWGILGGAMGTIVSSVCAAVVSVLYFVMPNTSLLHLTRPLCDFKALGKACVNGSSELMTSVATQLVSIIYNFQFVIYVGSNGVAAYGAIMYTNFMFWSVFMGYAMGVAPLISFNYGAGNKLELKNLLRKSVFITVGGGVIMFVIGQLLAPFLSYIYVGYDDALFQLTVGGFRIFSFSFLLCGMNMFGSAFFTALNNGLVSAGISFTRTLVFELASVLLLPLAFGVNGIWASLVVADCGSLILTIALMLAFRKRYGY